MIWIIVTLGAALYLTLAWFSWCGLLRELHRISALEMADVLISAVAAIILPAAVLLCLVHGAYKWQIRWQERHDSYRPRTHQRFLSAIERIIK